jgi:MFS family permease
MTTATAAPTADPTAIEPAAAADAEPANPIRNVALLFSCWALVSTGMMMVVSVTALVADILAPNKTFFAFPIALQWLGTAGMTVPASFIMRRIGRRGGFLIASVLISCGAGLAILAIYEKDFWLYCVASMVIGFASGFSWYYRFAAAEVVAPKHKAKAISLVLAGGIVAAIAGPWLADFAVLWLQPVTFAGAFLAIVFIHCAVAFLLLFVRIQKPSALDLTGGRPMLEIAKQPKFIVAVASGVIAYAAMVLLMSVTPKAMAMCGLTFTQSTSVIQWHVLGMYVPSFFTGFLIARFGVFKVLMSGGALMIVCIGIAAAGQDYINFWASMLVLGVAWNFLYVGATTLLTDTYTTAERAKAQAFNELTVFVFAGAGIFISGMVLQNFGWTAVALGTLPFVVAALAGVAWVYARRSRKEVAAE